jgi:glycosyltransferase involved in cell wall biosynthesis
MTESAPIPIGFAITELDPGGAERAFTQLVTRLDRRDWSPHVYCLSGHGELGETLESAGIPVTYLAASGRWDFGLIGRLTKALKHDRPALLQTFLHHANIAGRFAARRAGIPIVISGIRVAEKRNRWRLRIDRWTQQFVTMNVCVSASVADFSQRIGGLPASKLKSIPNGVDFERFAKATPIDWTTLHMPAEAQVILAVGRLDEQKQPDLAFRICQPLFADYPGLHLVFAGIGPLTDLVQSQAEELNVSDRVHLLGRRHDVPELMQASKLLLHVSAWEGSPNVLLEAVAAGLPVICSDNPGNRDALRGGEWGTIIESNQIEAFTKALRQHLDSPSDLTELANSSQHTISQELTWEAMVADYAKLYRNHLSR